MFRARLPSTAGRAGSPAWPGTLARVLRSVSAIRYVARCARAGPCPRSWRPTTTASTSSSCAAPARAPGARGGGDRRCARAPVELPVPEIVLVELDPQLPDAEPDPEIQDLLEASAGLNMGMDFLPGALPYTPGEEALVDPALAAGVVWLDALVENVDRTARNVNLLLLAPTAVADRPRRRALPPARGPRPGPGAAPFAQIRRARAARRRRARSRDADAELAPRVDARAARRGRRRRPGRVARGDDGGGLRRVAARAVRVAARVGDGGRGGPRG